MRESSNPVFRSLPKGQQGGYAQFGTGAGGYGAQAVHADPYAAQPYQDQRAVDTRPLTIDDVVTKTALHAGGGYRRRRRLVLPGRRNPALMLPFVLVGGIGGLALVLIATFGRKQDNPAIVLGYAAFEGLFVGSRRRSCSPIWCPIGGAPDDRAGDSRHDRCVRRDARGLRDRRDPRDPEAHPDARGRHVRCTRVGLGQHSVRGVRSRGDATADATVDRSQSSSRWCASCWRRSCSCWISTPPTS